MKLRNLFLTVVAGLLAFCGCEIFENDKPLLGITVTPEKVELPQEGGSATIQLSTDQAWTVNVPASVDWITVSPLTGTGSATVTIASAANTGKDRLATVTVKAGYDMVPVTVSQLGTVAAGDGITMETAFSASEARAWIIANLASGAVTPEKYYVKGKIHKVQTGFEASGTYGNATFFISDDGSAASDDFECFQIYYLGGRKWKSGDKEVAVGDDVIIYGPLTLYNTTPETAGKGAACLVKLNDEVVPVNGGGNEQTEITASTVADFITSDGSTYYRLTGKVSDFKTGTNANTGKPWMQFVLTDATGDILVYGFKDGEYDKWATKIKDGGTAVITGTYEYYANKQQHEVMNTTIESFTEGEGGESTSAEPSGSGTAESPYNVAAAISATANLTWTSNTDYQKTDPVYVKGKVSRIKENFDASGDYGNATFWIVDDGYTTEFYCFRVLYFDKKAFQAGQSPVLAVGDEVVIYSPLMNYQGNTPETVSNEGYVVRIGDKTSGGEATPTISNVRASLSENVLSLSWNSTGNITYFEWKVLGADGGQLARGETLTNTVTTTIGEQWANTGVHEGTVWTVQSLDYGEFTVTVSAYGATGAVVASGSTTFTHRDPSQGGEVTVVFTKDQLAAAACKGASVAMDDVISFTNSSDYGTTSVTELRIYKSQTLSFTAAGATITKIEFECGANGVTKQGPGCWGAGAPNGYSFEENGKNGVWEGSESTVSFTATDNQVRIVSLKVTYEK